MSRGNDMIAKLVPGGARALAHLSDDELLTNTRRLVGKSNQIFAALLAHLAEVEVRGIHRKRLCASLYTYCVYELRFSEDAAARRSTAARLVKEFPVLFDAIAGGELHLTGLLMIGPHLTLENHQDVLARAKFRTKKELGRLVRELHPLPQVPDRMEPLGLELKLAPRNPSWEKVVAAMCGPVRNLPPGERPGDWANGADAEDGGANANANDLAADDTPREEPKLGASAPAAIGDGPSEPGLSPRRPLLDLPPRPQRYELQFTTNEEHVQLVERAKALLCRTSPGISLGDLHLQAMRLLVAALEKQKFAVSDKPRNRSKDQPRDAEKPSMSSGSRAAERAGEAVVAVRETESTKPVAPPQSQGGRVVLAGNGASSGDALRTKNKQENREVAFEAGAVATKPPRQRVRYIPASERRAVFQRDQGRCTYSNEQGERCCETHYLELHHVRAFAKGGQHTSSNLTLRCRAHNALAAEEDFGREAVEQKRNSSRHESLAAQRPSFEHPVTDR